MKKPLMIAAALSMVIGLAGCASHRAPVMPPPGFVFARYKAPLMTNAHGKELGPKTGTAHTYYVNIPFLWPYPIDFAWEDACLREAARNGDISTVRFADYEVLNILGLYTQFKVHAYGE